MTLPPIDQVLLTVQFQPAVASMTILDWADLRDEFIEELPIFSQLPRAGAMPTKLDQVAMESPFGLPRLAMSSSDLSLMVMMQDDRISVGWQRTVPLDTDPSYPGFKSLLDNAVELVSKIVTFISMRAAESPQFVAGELAYTNAFVLQNEQGVRVRRLTDIYTCIAPIAVFPHHSMSIVFQRAMSKEAGDGFDGMSEMRISGALQAVGGQLVSQLATVVRFDFPPEPSFGISAEFELAHVEATRCFSSLVKPDAMTILDTI